MDGYRFEEQLGSGGMALVYAATHLALERRVAIKVIRPEITYLPVGVARFEREAKVAAALRHPGLLQVFDYGRLPDNRPYLVMRLLEGRTLREALRQERRWPRARIAAALTPVAEALDAMHAQGLVHRDIKPDNIFLERGADGSECAIVMDFGLATLFQDTHHLTQQGMLLGTPTYLPPEASERDTREPAADVYALAVTLFELVVGRPPFRDRDPVRLMARRLVTDAPAPSDLLKGLTTAVDPFFARALAREPSQRFESCGELLAAFRAIEAPTTEAPSLTEAHLPEPSEALPPLPVPRWPGAAARLAVVVGVATVALWVAGLPPFRLRRPPAPPDEATLEPAQARTARAEPVSPAEPEALPDDPAGEAPSLPEPEPTVAPATSSEPIAATRRRRRRRPRAEQAPLMEEPPLVAATRAGATEAEPTMEATPLVDPAPLLDRGRRALLRGQAVQARSAYRQATGVAPESVDAWLGLGIASEELGDRLAARRALVRAQSLARSARERQAIDARLARLAD